MVPGGGGSDRGVGRGVGGGDGPRFVVVAVGAFGDVGGVVVGYVVTPATGESVATVLTNSGISTREVTSASFAVSIVVPCCALIKFSLKSSVNASMEGAGPFPGSMPRGQRQTSNGKAIWRPRLSWDLHVPSLRCHDLRKESSNKLKVPLSDTGQFLQPPSTLKNTAVAFPSMEVVAFGVFLNLRSLSLLVSLGGLVLLPTSMFGTVIRTCLTVRKNSSHAAKDKSIIMKEHNQKPRVVRRRIDLSNARTIVSLSKDFF